MDTGTFFLTTPLPILLKDGKFGIVIREDQSSCEVGIQVPGEDNIRWIPVENIKDAGNGALYEVGAM